MVAFGPDRTDVGRQVRQLRQQLVHGEDAAVKDVQQADQILRIVSREGLGRYVGTFDEEVGVLFDFAIHFRDFGLFFADGFLHRFTCVYIVDNDDSRGFRRDSIGSYATRDRCQDIGHASLSNATESQAQGLDGVALAVVDGFTGMAAGKVFGRNSKRLFTFSSLPVDGPADGCLSDIVL